MPLNQQQITQLGDSITGYAFPTVYFDFTNNIAVNAQNMSEVENLIFHQLESNEIVNVKYGLANVLYWGYAQIGYRGIRINDFVANVTQPQLLDFIALLRNGMPTMQEISRIRMPQYSGISFSSKILMFLNPTDYCVLDQQLAQLRSSGSLKHLNELAFGANDTQIRITRHNEGVYNRWRNECLAISQQYYQGEHRAVDVERGFFNLVQQHYVADAQAIYNAA